MLGQVGFYVGRFGEVWGDVWSFALGFMWFSH